MENWNLVNKIGTILDKFSIRRNNTLLSFGGINMYDLLKIFKKRKIEIENELLI